MSRRWITIFADASFCGQTGAAGWAGWIKHGPEMGLFIDGTFKQQPRDPGEAELLAMVKSFLYACKWLDPTAVRFSLQSDCKPALKELAVQRGRTPLSAHATRLLLDEAVARGLSLHFKHVKGHQKGITGRSWVNEECDKRAKAQMRRERALRESVAAQ